MKPVPDPVDAYRMADDRANHFGKQPKKIPFAPPIVTPSVETLYSESNDGEITIEIDPISGVRKLVTAVDISSLYKEKRLNAIQLGNR